MITFNSIIEKFGEMGEKTGWSYIVISQEAALKLKPNNKQSFRVRGKLDNLVIKQKALMPMGEGDFILPLNTTMRKKLKKRVGDELLVSIEEDTSEVILNPQLMNCLEMEPEALNFFYSMPPSHQKYFSKWIGDAKTEPTIVKRITQTVNAMLKKQRFDEMMRANKGK